mgnify:CR=1 FL=1
MSSPEGPTGPSDVPSAEELARIAIPATLRRAPRYRGFVVAGAVLGLLVAIGLVALGVGRTAAGTGIVLAFVGAVLALTGASLGAAVAVLVDRRSAPRA